MRVIISRNPVRWIIPTIPAMAAVIMAITPLRQSLNRRPPTITTTPIITEVTHHDPLFPSGRGLRSPRRPRVRAKP
ncbi:hypothetical protein OCEANICA350_10678 [Oceanicaulis sp. 350]|nr:hypothetical protein OCEANICA350_10678 [Oceanicaulis sp. 350]